MNSIILATTNPGKIEEMKVISDRYSLILQSFEQIPETGTTFVENAILKARHATKISGLPALADDSGLVVDALNGEPGIYSARYAGENEHNQKHIDKLLTNLGSHTNRKATFYCILVYMRHFNDPAPIICQGTWEGSILHEPRGQNGFGYDPIFYVPTHNCSSAELVFSEKISISHRAKAIAQLAAQLP